ncbi:MAG: glycine cleavage system protein H [Bacteroidota bacterium]
MLQAPKNLYYTKQHLWLQKIGSYDFCVGITDFGQKEIGGIDLIELSLKEPFLKKGSIWGMVYGINDTFQLVAPFDCKIVEGNKDLPECTAFVNTDPYKYWFAILSATIDTATFLTFDEYKQFTQ